MSEDRYVLGIDTSNYKTSLAVTYGEKIIFDMRRLLVVKEGKRGLRQSEALFQHIKNLPDMFNELNRQLSENIINPLNISAIAYSSKPRPVEGSYMPCFLAGKSQALSLAALISVPTIEFSHQEGHIEAVRRFNGDGLKNNFLTCHFSGGTCEVLKVFNKEDGYDIEIIGGTNDISFGQVLDRIGVALGMTFPCGESLDSLALSACSSTDILTPIKVHECKINLSGFESQIQRVLKQSYDFGLIREVFDKISDSIYKMLIQASEKHGLNDVIMTGGVSSSKYIRNGLTESLEKKGIGVRFDEYDFSSDNAVGIALLGGRCLWG